MLDIGWFVRAIHILAATAWVGGSFMYMLIVVPALRQAGPAPAIASHIALLFKRMVNYCIGILLLSGAYLTFDRLTQTTLGLPYIMTLGLKILATLGLIVLASYLAQSNLRRIAKQKTRFSQLAPQVMLALGIIVFILGALLNALYELALAPR